MRRFSFALAGLLVACPSASPSTPGEQGPAGLPGPTGATGPQGPAGAQGPAGEVVYVDGGVARGPAGESVRLFPLAIGDAACAQGGVRLAVDGGTALICNGAPGAVGPAGPAGPRGLPGGSVQVVSVAPDAGCASGGVKLIAADGGTTLVCNGLAGASGLQGPAGATGQQGPAGAAGPQGAAGTAGTQGPAGAAGPQGSPGASVTITPLGIGDAACPWGGARFTVGTAEATACNGAPGGSGGGGGFSYDGGVAEKVYFAGYTPGTNTGNLGGRAGANALCHAAFAGSHFCVDWEYDQAGPPGPVPNGSVWIDLGDANLTSRYHHSYTSQLYSCLNWTTDVETTWGGNQVRGTVVNATGAFDTTWVSSTNGGCQTPRALPCCRGGTAVRFRGFTSQTYAGSLGGRAGANAICHSVYAGSHFCVDWEFDQAGVPGPVPAAGAWIDLGDSQAQQTRFYRSYTAQLYSCVNWTTNLAQTVWGGNQVRGTVVTPTGAFDTTWVSSTNGGCQTPRTLPCCE